MTCKLKTCIQTIHDELYNIAPESFKKTNSSTGILYSLALDISNINQALEDFINQKFTLYNIEDEHWKINYSFNSIVCFDTYDYDLKLNYKVDYKINRSNNFIFLNTLLNSNSNSDIIVLDQNLLSGYGVEVSNKKFKNIVNDYLYKNLKLIKTDYSNQLFKSTQMIISLRDILSKFYQFDRNIKFDLEINKTYSSEDLYNILKDKLELQFLINDINCFEKLEILKKIDIKTQNSLLSKN